LFCFKQIWNCGKTRKELMFESEKSNVIANSIYKAAAEILEDSGEKSSMNKFYK